MRKDIRLSNHQQTQTYQLMKKVFYIFAASLFVTSVVASCSREKECVCYYPEGVVTHETAEECHYLNQNEMWHDSAFVVMKFCLEE